MAKRTITKIEGAPSGGWMVTFSDMNTLLLTFFVLLFAMSSITSQGFQEFFREFAGDQLGLLQEGGAVSTGTLMVDPIPEIPPHPVRTALSILREGPRDQVGSTLPEGVEISISDAPDGAMVIVLADRILFRPGSVELSGEAESVLERMRLFLKELFARTDRRITLEGHTDDSIPRQESYIISAQRAEAVLNFLLQDGQLPPARFSIVGYGAARPRVPNNTAANRARNRRVSIVVEPPDISIFEPEEL